MTCAGVRRIAALAGVVVIGFTPMACTVGQPAQKSGGTLGGSPAQPPASPSAPASAFPTAPAQDEVSYNLLAVSASRLWGADEWGWFLLRDGTWHSTGPETGESGGCRAVAATDGALWVGTPEGLVRATSEGSQLIARARGRDRDFSCPELSPGAAGSVWVGESGDPAGELIEQGSGTVRYRPDGTMDSIGRPPGYSRTCLQASGPDGSVWVSKWVQTDPEEMERCPLVEPARWDGTAWIPIEIPDWAVTDYEWLSLTVTDDGAAWLALHRGLARYFQREWTRIGAAALGQVWAVEDGRVCGLQAGPSPSPPKPLICYDASGRKATVSTGKLSDERDGQFSFAGAPDGAVWVSGSGEVRLLAEGLPRNWE